MHSTVPMVFIFLSCRDNMKHDPLSQILYYPNIKHVFCKMKMKPLLTLSWRRSLYFRNRSIVCSANQWTGFYMIGASVIRVNTSIVKFYFLLKLCENWISFSFRGVGCIFYEMVAGRPMFPGSTAENELTLIFKVFHWFDDSPGFPTH